MFWIKEPSFIAVCVLVACIVFFTAHLVEYRYRLLLWLDAIGMAAYSVMGAMIALDYGVSPYAAVVMGIMTATFGGIFRDVLSGEKSVLFRDEIYITAALLGSVSFVLMLQFGVEKRISIVIGVSLAFLLRAAALKLDWSMPRYKPRQGRKIK